MLEVGTRQSFTEAVSIQYNFLNDSSKEVVSHLKDVFDIIVCSLTQSSMFYL